MDRISKLTGLSQDQVTVFVFALMKAASDAERAVRRAQRDRSPFLDRTVTTSAPGSE